MKRARIKLFISWLFLATSVSSNNHVEAFSDDMLVDDFAHPELTSKFGARWRGVSDRVMGGLSKVSVARDVIDGRQCLRLTGEVSLENNGGFVQATLNLSASGGGFDASNYEGIRLVVRGNDEKYSVHLRTPDNVRPWQSYRAHFKATPDWQIIQIPYRNFTPYRLNTPLDTTRLRRIGLVAIGRRFDADLAIDEIFFY